MNPRLAALLLWLAAPLATGAESPPPREVSGIVPSLAYYNDEGECGTGAVVPWAGRLWVITYAPHAPKGSTDRLHEITPDLRRVARPESVGGTHAARLIHRESRQLFIGPYVIDTNGNVRVIPSSQLFGRLTGIARHLGDPAHRVVYATMEEGVAEVDVRTLEVREHWADEQRTNGAPHAGLPGYHGKGFYSAQGRYVYANNGDHAPAARWDPAVPSGVLAEWDGTSTGWTVVRRNQFTEVTGPGGIEGNAPEDDRVWSVGWDHRSLLLATRDGGAWHVFRLPKPSHSYDGAHGWNTEWPRIRDIGEPDLLMTMHGAFWRFPRGFASTNSAGIRPRSAYLKVVGDFCRWNGRVVLGCDDTARSEFLNRDRLKGSLPGPGTSHSNLWFLEAEQLDALGPALGRGAVWVRDTVTNGQPSDPFLFAGFDLRSLHVAHGNPAPAAFRLEVDRRGDGQWQPLRRLEVAPGQAAWTEFTPEESGAWIRIVPETDAMDVTAQFYLRQRDPRPAEPGPIAQTLSAAHDPRASTGVLHVTRGQPPGLRYVTTAGAGYDLDADLRLTLSPDTNSTRWIAQHLAIATNLISADAASLLYVDEGGQRWRLPRAHPSAPAESGRLCREVCTERNLLNAGGTFYELPARNAGGFAKIRPIATHKRSVADFASYRGLLVLSGVAPDASGPHVVRSDDGIAALWVGAVDDLWQFGKPRGTGGPWKDTPVRNGQPSDPYLMTGFDRKTLTLSHAGGAPVTFTVECDLTGTGVWAVFARVNVSPGRSEVLAFPDALGAYWMRVTPDGDTTATAQCRYD